MKNLAISVISLFAGISAFAAVDTVKASRFGYEKTDATKCLQAAFDSDAATVIIDNVGSEWLSGSLRINRDNLTIVFDEGVTLRALPGAFPKKSASFIHAKGRKNIRFIGREGSLMTMNKEEYRQIDARFQGGHRHAFCCMNNDGVTFSGMTITSSGGDGIYVGHGSKNFLIENTSCLDNARQGISVISCENLLIRNCHFDNTNGTPPQAGIDFEPNRNDECLVNCVVENSTFNHNAGSGITAYLPNLNGSSKPVSITIRNCESFDNENGVRVALSRSSGNLLKGSIVCESCRIGKSRKANVGIDDVGVDFPFIMKDCTIDNTGSPYEALVFTSGGFTSPNLGNITVENLKVIDDKTDRAPVKFEPLFGNGVTDDIHIDVTLNGTTYDVKPALAAIPPAKDKPPITSEKADNLVAPVVTGEVINPKIPTLNLRGNHTLLLLAKKGDRVTIWVRAEPVVPGRQPVKTTFQLNDPKDKVIDTFEMMTDGSERTISFTAGLEGMYRFIIPTAGQRVSVWSDHAGQGLLADPQLSMISPKVKLYFEVPAGVTDTAVILCGGSSYEIVSDVALLDPSGKIVQSEKDTPAAVLRIRRPAGAPAEIWCMDIGKTVEDCSVMMGQGLKPVLATSPQLLLRSK